MLFIICYTQYFCGEILYIYIKIEFMENEMRKLIDQVNNFGKSLNEQLKTNVLLTLKPKLALAAQKVYDEWEQDENGYCDMLGEGGICQDIADAMANVLSNNGIECSTVSQQSGEQHVYVVAKTEEGVYNVDIPPYLYETGGGYCWKKIPDVEFDERYVVIDRLSSDPNEFDDYVGDF